MPKLPECGCSQKLFAEFFAGIGLVHLALQQSGWRCAYANDIDVKKCEMYTGHFGPAPYFHLEDVWQTSHILANLPDAPFLATASFPCIDLSLAGHCKGFDGEHSSTYFGFLNVVREMVARPRVVMLENVTGFLTSRGGADFRRAVIELATLGYYMDAIVLDARVFLPQSRPRTFVFGYHESLESHLIKRHDASGISADWRAAMEASPMLRPPPILKAMDAIELPTGWATQPFNQPAARKYRLADFINADPDADWWTPQTTQQHLDLMEPPTRRRVNQALASNAAWVGAAFRRTRHGAARTEVRFDMAGCLRTPKGGSAKQIIVAIENGTLRMRWMTAREYANLQGAPDYQITVPELQAMYGFGDGVCVPVIRWIDQNILTPIYNASAATSAVA